MTRSVEALQMELGEVDISKIEFPTKSRDDIPRILKGLQYVYKTPAIREKIFNLLEQRISPKIDKSNGRPGMDLWKIFVMGVLRLDLNCDYDRLHSLVNYFSLVRQMLGHSDSFEKHHYHIQTIKDNVCLLTPELLEEINQVIVEAGHLLLKKKESDPLRGRCDSFVVETNVHYPTDINLLFDAVRKTIELTAQLCSRHDITDWRQHAYNVRHVKRLMRSAQNKKRNNAKTEEQKRKKEQLIVQAHKEYLETVQNYIFKARFTLDAMKSQGLIDQNEIISAERINYFISHADRQINQIERRIFNNETIPHHEKVFSIFQPHTEWIVKGKAGVPFELGIRVCIMEDQHQFILHHMVMDKQTDVDVAVLMTTETQKDFPELKSVSFDKGFHSPENQNELREILDTVALKKKGKLSQKAKLAESAPEFRQASHKHSAVESAINALEVHGLDICPDHGIIGFKRYVALAIVARNIHRIGDILTKREQKAEERKRKKYFCYDEAIKLAA